jgi:hypothetical protein
MGTGEHSAPFAESDACPLFARIGRRQVVLGLLGRPPARGVALLMRVSDRSMLREEGNPLARRWLARPGSTIKPFSLLALLEAGKLNENDAYVCPRKLTVASRDFACVHPDVPLAMNVSRAIAYSCNCAVAHFAQRFRPDKSAAAVVALVEGRSGGADAAPVAGEMLRKFFNK